MYSFLLANWGFLAKGIREVAGKVKKNTVDDIVSTRLTLWLFGSLVGTLIAFLIWKDSEMSYLIILAQLTNLGAVFSVDFYFLGKKNTFIPGLLRFLSQLLFLGLIWLFFMKWNSIFLVLLLLTIIKLVEGLSFYGIFKSTSKSKAIPKVKFKKSLTVLRSNFHLGLGSKMSFITLSLPLILIPFYYSETTLGIYSVAHKLFIVLITIFSVINIVLAPYIVEKIKINVGQLKRNYHKNLLLIGGISLIIGSVFYILRVQIIELLFESSYYDAIDLIPYFALLTPIWGVYTITTAYINNLGLDKSYAKSSVFHLLISLVMTIMALNFFELKYVIPALAVSTFLITLFLYTRVMNFLKIKHA